MFGKIKIEIFFFLKESEKPENNYPIKSNEIIPKNLHSND